MMNRSTLLLIAATLIPCTSAAQSPDSLSAAVDRAFAQWNGTAGPGCAVSASHGSRTVLARGYGMANLETDTPIRPGSIFHVASVSKQFTAMAVSLLARERKLSLDDDVRKYIPELPDYGKRITIRHLLHHTSGLRDQWDLLSMARGRFEENRITEADVMEIVTRQTALNFDPGTQWLYSNTGYTLAAVIVKRVSGRSLSEFAEERIFRPLGMTQTHFHDDYTMIVPGRTSAYARRGSGWRVSIPNYDTYGATSLFSTVGDLLKWEANFESASVGDRALLGEMQRSGMLASGDSTSYGLGVSMSLYRGARLVGHSGGDAGYRTYIGRLPEHGFAVAVLCNASTANPVALAQQVIDVYVGPRLPAQQVAQQQAAAGVTLTKEQLAARSGLFRNTATGELGWISSRDGRLVLGRDGRGPMLTAVDSLAFTQPNGVRIEFAPDLRSATHTTPLGQVRAERRQPSTLRGAALRQYAGTYYSEELGATYTVAATDSTLELSTRATEPQAVRPATGDIFEGRFQVEFTRARGGAPTGMLVSTGRVRRVRFEKVASR